MAAKVNWRLAYRALMMSAILYPTLAYNVTLPESNTTQVAVAETSYGIHIFALSKEGYIVHQYPFANGSFDGQVWYNLPNPHSGSTPKGALQQFDCAPAVGQNPDGRLEIFARSHISLDFWHWYQTDASDPNSWVGPREPACLCNFPPCANQTRCGNNANCGNDGYNCADPDFDNNSDKWWNTQAVFPTNNPTVVADKKDGRLKVYYRNFDGLLYVSQQKIAGNSTKYEPPAYIGALVE